MKRAFKRKLFLFLSPLLVVLGVSIVLLTTEKTKTVSLACSISNYSGRFVFEDQIATFDTERIDVPRFAQDASYDTVLGLAVPSERWIEVDLSEQRLRAWDGNSLFLETAVSTGLPWWPTPTGEFRIWIKLRYTKMEGGEGRYYYYLPNVPYVMYFENSKIPGWRGYGLHGTYWHNDFGTQRSHGCVNLPTNIAERIFYWVGPGLGDNQWSIRATKNNPGTRIVIHE